MRLKEVFKGIDFKIDKDCEINQIKRKSDEVEKDDLYFCFAKNIDKALFQCEEAKRKGALIAFSNFEIENCVKLNDTRETFSKVCANFYQNACDDLKIVGITGTNGKTTTSHIVAEMLRRNGRNAGVIGTSGVFYNGKVFDSPLTTPDADFLHKTFLEMRNDGVEYVIMEVSAHAIEQQRIKGIKFKLGVLTNITQDHLDYFETIENYAKTKLSFFDKEYVEAGIICIDDCYAKRLLKDSNIPLYTYGLKNPSDTFAIDTNCSINGTRFVANVFDNVLEIKTNLVGEYNIYNSLAALEICKCLGLTNKELALGLNFIKPIEGRFNVINFTGRYVVVDFAHSPDSMEHVLKTCRDLTDGKVFTIFGCGGNRDRTKRWQMGEIAERYSDVVCLTNDNPRYEKEEDIIKDIEKGMSKKHFVEVDRYKAIKKMISLADEGDIILIAGKGAEKYQEIAGEKLKYNDFDSVYNYYKELTSPNVEKGKRYYDC